MKHLLLTSVLLSGMCLGSAATAAETSFLQSLDGKWSGKGTVTTRIGAKPVNVNCRIDFASQSSSLSMTGNCRGLVVVKRSIAANIKVQGSRYSGTYTGPSGQSSSLSGSRKGQSINLAVRWARETNGDRSATMTITKLGANGVRLQTVDKDPATGRSLVTSRIDLRR